MTECHRAKTKAGPKLPTLTMAETLSLGGCYRASGGCLAWRRKFMTLRQFRPYGLVRFQLMPVAFRVGKLDRNYRFSKNTLL